MTPIKPRTAVLFVCLGNICRSPLAEGVFRAVAAECGMADRFHIDSAGTGAWHVGSAPDPRSIAVALANKVDISGQKARRLAATDFERFDLILGMDRSNVETMLGSAPRAAHGRIHLYMDYATGREIDVPDPYYGGRDGFASVYGMICEASAALAARLAERPLSDPISGQASSTI